MNPAPPVVVWPRTQPLGKAEKRTSEPAKLIAPSGSRTKAPVESRWTKGTRGLTWKEMLAKDELTEPLGLRSDGLKLSVEKLASQEL